MLTCLLVFFFGFWWVNDFDNSKTHPKISFKQFKQWYFLNQNAWYDRDSAVDDKFLNKLSLKKNDIVKITEYCRYNTPSKCIIARFNHIDYIRYKRFKKQLDNEAKLKMYNDRLNVLLKSVESDLNNYIEQNNLKGDK